MYLRKGWKPTKKQDEEEYRPDWTTRILALASLVAGIVALLMSIFA